MSSRISPKQLADLRGTFRRKFHLSDGGRQIVGALNRVLGVSVILYDGQKDETHHFESSSNRRLAVRNGVIDGRQLCRLQARINDRWLLFVSSWRGMHPDAEALLKWAAGKLAAHLPRNKREDESTDAPLGGGGGGESGGGAEVGIPIWWARNTRDN
jgi:hypothetical protein